MLMPFKYQLRRYTRFESLATKFRKKWNSLLLNNAVFIVTAVEPQISHTINWLGSVAET
jgi:hypothetical protein